MARKKKSLVDFALTEGNLKLPAVTYRTELEWRNGVPCLTRAPIRVSEDPQEMMPMLLRRVLDLPYDGRDPSLQGLSNAEAIAVQVARAAAMGDLDATSLLLDRLLGRPQQNIKSVSLSGNLNDFLDKIAKETHIETVEVEDTQPAVSSTSAEDL